MIGTVVIVIVIAIIVSVMVIIVSVIVIMVIVVGISEDGQVIGAGGWAHPWGRERSR